MRLGFSGAHYVSDLRKVGKAVSRGGLQPVGRLVHGEVHKTANLWRAVRGEDGRRVKVRGEGEGGRWER